ncbi:MAG TPA: zf-TFIIB domain-containing protein, partial [bacterium]|nr:zf-TFIIB domain-containing protein [bacterium]
TSCRGSFLDKGEADRFVDDPQKLTRLIEAPLRAPQTGHPCPRCGAVMTEGGFCDDEYRLEVCDGCGGIWFATRQLSRLKRIVKDAVAPSAPKKRRGDTTVARRVVSKQNALKHRCPKCEEPATTWDRWSCSCGWVWDAFTTHGVCPKCQRHWDRTRCPRCGESTPHEDWYVHPH